MLECCLLAVVFSKILKFLALKTLDGSDCLELFLILLPFIIEKAIPEDGCDEELDESFEEWTSDSEEDVLSREEIIDALERILSSIEAKRWML